MREIIRGGGENENGREKEVKHHGEKEKEEIGDMGSPNAKKKKRKKIERVKGTGKTRGKKMSGKQGRKKLKNRW